MMKQAKKGNILESKIKKFVKKQSNVEIAVFMKLL
jgi:hypothetical protein